MMLNIALLKMLLFNGKLLFFFFFFFFFFQSIPGKLNNINVTLLTQMSLLQSSLTEHEVGI